MEKIIKPYHNRRADSVFTTEMKEFMRNNYDYLTDGDFAEMFDVPYESVKGYVSNFKDKSVTRITKDTKAYLLNNYKLTTDDVLLRDLKISKETLDKFVHHYKLIRKNVCIPDVPHIPNIQKNSNHSKYSIDVDFFNVIDSELKAYWLGFFIADGSVLKDKGIELQLADKEHVQKFLDAVNCNAPIRKKNISGKYTSYRFYVKNDMFANNLEKHGCVNNKSLIVKYPSTIPEHLHKHFIRGYFDGDGCVHVNTDVRPVRISINFTGTKDMLDSIQDILNKECGLTRVAYENAGKAVECHWSGINNMRTFYNYLYADAKVYLNRKFEKFQKAYDYYNNKVA